MEIIERQEGDNWTEEEAQSYKVVSALNHNALGTKRTKVVFRSEEGDEVAYWMPSEIYRLVYNDSLGDEGTYNMYLSDFNEKALIEAKNTDCNDKELDDYELSEDYNSYNWKTRQ